MKRLFAIGLAFLLPAAALLAGNTTEFYVDGLKVIHRQSPKDVISVRLFVQGGSANYAKEKEGVEALAFQVAMQGGTKSMDKVAFQSAAEKIGTSFGSNTTYDYGDLSMTCIKAFWNESWNLFADAVLNPAFDAAEFETMRAQAVANAKSSESDPDSHLRNLAMVHSFGADNDYGKIPSGSAASLEGLKLSDLSSHYANVIGKKNVFLVVVGNIDSKDLKAKIEATLAKMPDGNSPKVIKRTLITEDGHYIEERDIATNYIRGLMSAPRMNTPDGVPMLVAMNILGDRYFEELRTKRSLSYAPSAFYARSVVNNPYNVIYISTQDPKQSMQVMVDEINKIKKEGFDASELTNTKQSFLTYYYMDLETSASQTNSLGLAELNGGWEMDEAFTDKVNAITLADLNRVFDTYTKAIKWTYLGKKADVDVADFPKPVDIPAKNKPY
jgi:predicted Zn-dependent peptidase